MIVIENESREESKENFPLERDIREKVFLTFSSLDGKFSLRTDAIFQFALLTF